MKKIIVAVLAIVVFAGSDARALTVGDEIIIGESYSAIPFSKFQLGITSEFVLDRDLKSDAGGGDMAFEGNRFLFKPAVSLFENLDIYAKVGAGRDKLDNPNKDAKVDSEAGPAFGAGLRANLINWDESGIHLGMDAQYLRLDTGIDTVTTPSTSFSSPSGDFTVAQWQVALFVVKEFLQATLYGGGSYAESSVKYDYETSTGLKGNAKGENDSVVGVLAGVNIHVTDVVIFFAEGHLIDETSLSVGFNARF